MSKYYFQEDAETCYTIDFHKQYMKEHGLKELTLYKAKIFRGTGYFYCNYHNLIGEVGHCGKQCVKYNPRNNKSGICVHYSYMFEQTEETIVIKL